MSSNYQQIVNSQTIAPSASCFVVVNMQDCKYFRPGVEVRYNVTASTTGLDLYIYSGMGPFPGGSGSIPSQVLSSMPSSGTNTFPFWGDNSTNAVVLTTVTPGLASPQVKRTSFYLDFPQIRLQGLVCFAFVNRDAANAATLSFYADIS